MADKRSVLLTGASGRIGRYLTRLWKDEYDLRLMDMAPPRETYGLPFSEANAANLNALLELCRGVDTLVHFASSPDAGADWDTLLPGNVIGVYNGFEAARLAGCRRVVYASSVNATSAYPRDRQIDPDMPPRPPNLYGAAKVFGEAIAHVYAHRYGLSCLCLRFATVVFEAGEDHRDGPFKRLLPDNPALDTILTVADLGRLVTRSVEAPDGLRFGIYHGLSNNRYKRLDITGARRDLGYDPQDDAFAMAEANRDSSVQNVEGNRS